MKNQNFYAYKGDAELGHESCGTENRHVWKDLKTLRGAIARMDDYGYKSFQIYTFTDFYDEKTFKLVYKREFVPMMKWKNV
jgi:hypothetical protein